MKHKHSIEIFFVVSSILLHLSFLKTEPNWLNSIIGSITSEKRMVHALNTKPSIIKGEFKLEREVFLAAFVPRFGRQFNDHTVAFRLHTQKLELNSKWIIPCESTAEEVSFEW